MTCCRGCNQGHIQWPCNFKITFNCWKHSRSVVGVQGGTQGLCRRAYSSFQRYWALYVRKDSHIVEISTCTSIFHEAHVNVLTPPVCDSSWGAQVFWWHYLYIFGSRLTHYQVDVQLEYAMFQNDSTITDDNIWQTKWQKFHHIVDELDEISKHPSILSFLAPLQRLCSVQRRV